MKEELLVTYRENKVLFARVQDGKIIQIQAEPADGGLLGNIYVGKVRNVVKNINAAFVEFQKGQMGYLSLGASCHPIRTDGSRQGDDRILIGDEIFVQVQREAVKTKPPGLSAHIDLPGRYVVLTTKPDTGISISKKIRDKKVREQLQQWIMPYQQDAIGFIARTNSTSCTKEELCSELERLLQQYEEMVRVGTHRVIFSTLRTEEKGYLSQIRDSGGEAVRTILTDQESLYREISEYLQNSGLNDRLTVQLWDPDHGKMDAVYDISRTIQKALQPRVWLRNGGYLVIQPTEALVSIDVNTGKAISKKKDVEQTFFKVNVEAAKEIARQLRLRNLSGMILVDFIDMKSEEHNQELMDILRREVKKDPVQTTVVDMTGLGLVELTRKKVRKPLYDQLYTADTEKQGE